MAHFQRWLKNPEVCEMICRDYVSPEEREIFGLPPLETTVAAEESNPVKARQTESAPIKLSVTA